MVFEHLIIMYFGNTSLIRTKLMSKAVTLPIACYTCVASVSDKIQLPYVDSWDNGNELNTNRHHLK